MLPASDIAVISIVSFSKVFSLSCVLAFFLSDFFIGFLAVLAGFTSPFSESDPIGSPFSSSLKELSLAITL